MPIPKRHKMRLGFRLQACAVFKNFLCRCAQELQVSSHQLIAAQGDRDWTLCALAHREAGHTQERGFFLNAPRVRDDESGLLLQSQKLEIGQRIEQTETRREGDFADFTEALAGA